MGSSRKSKSTRAKGARPHQRPSRPGISREAIKQPLVKDPEIPLGVQNEIENQRDVLVTVITLAHCLHVVLDYQEGDLDEEPNPILKSAAGWASLPEMTKMILERTEAVLHALDSLNLTKASKTFGP